jgi:ketosteroid isomerase-like protein
MGEKSVEVVKGVYGAFERGDVAAVLAAMADDIEWYEAEGMPYGDLHHGPDAVAQKVLGARSPRTSQLRGYAGGTDRLRKRGSGGRPLHGHRADHRQGAGPSGRPRIARA